GPAFTRIRIVFVRQVRFTSPDRQSAPRHRSNTMPRMPLWAPDFILNRDNFGPNALAPRILLLTRSQDNAYVARYTRKVCSPWQERYIFDSIQEVQDIATMRPPPYKRCRLNLGIGCMASVENEN